MALVRILVDGYSLLHQWKSIVPNAPRYSMEARDELLHWLRLYRDAVGTPITIFFDGMNAPMGVSKPTSEPEFEILYSWQGKTADELIERVVHRIQPYGDVLVVTDDHAERDTVISLGGHAQSCDHFVQTVLDTLGEQKRQIERMNLRERKRFRQQ